MSEAEIQNGQIEALSASRGKVAQRRNDIMLQRESYYHDIQEIDLALKRLDERLRNQTFQRDAHLQSAKLLSSAWLGRQMPDSISNELSEKERLIKDFDERIEGIQKSRDELKDRHSDKNADYQLAARDCQKMEDELKQIDCLISELRGF